MAIGLRLPRIPRVPTTLRRVARSFGYASMDVFQQYNPTLSRIHQETKKIVDETKRKRNNLIYGNLLDHKRQRGRIILPKAA
jgi:hypothetical protein